MGIDYQDIGKRIRAVRKKRGLSQEKLAEMVGVGASHISHIEKGHTKMSVLVLVDISNALNISADELLGGHIYMAREVLCDEIARLLADCSGCELNIIIDVIKSLKNSLRGRQ